jgi:hypothetical protein
MIFSGLMIDAESYASGGINLSEPFRDIPELTNHAMTDNLLTTHRVYSLYLYPEPSDPPTLPDWTPP